MGAARASGDGADSVGPEEVMAEVLIERGTDGYVCVGREAPQKSSQARGPGKGCTCPCPLLPR